MKKLFVSVPMRGRSDENIEKSIKFMADLASVIFGEELVVVHNLKSETPPEDVNNTSVYYLGQAISKMSEVDYFIGVSPEFAKLYPGCATEDFVAMAYDIPRHFINPKAYVHNDAFADLLVEPEK